MSVYKCRVVAVLAVVLPGVELASPNSAKLSYICITVIE